ncbi:MAG: hypothetical protein ACE5KE_00615 [Methanosarcinales archaeon]
MDKEIDKKFEKMEKIANDMAFDILGKIKILEKRINNIERFLAGKDYNPKKSY